MHRLPSKGIFRIPSSFILFSTRSSLSVLRFHDHPSYDVSSGPRSLSTLASTSSASAFPSTPIQSTNVPSSLSSSSTPAESSASSSSSSSSASADHATLVSWLRNNHSNSGVSLSVFQCMDRINTLPPSVLVRYIQDYIRLLLLSPSSSSFSTKFLTTHEWQIVREAFFLWLQDHQSSLTQTSFLSIEDINSLTYILSSSVMYMFTSTTTATSSTTTTSSPSSIVPKNSSSTNTKVTNKRRSDTLVMNINVWKQISFALCQRVLRYYEDTLGSPNGTVTYFHFQLYYISLRLLTLKRLQYPEYTIAIHRYLTRAFDHDPTVVTLLPISVWSDILGSLSFTGDRIMMEKILHTFRQLITEKPTNDTFLNYIFQNKYKDSNEYLLSTYRSSSSPSAAAPATTDSKEGTVPPTVSSNNESSSSVASVTDQVSIKDKNGLASFHALTWMLKRSYDGGIRYSAIQDGLVLLQTIYPFIEKIKDNVFRHPPTSSASSIARSSSTLFMGDFLSASLHMFSVMQQMVLLSTASSSSSTAPSRTDISSLCLPIMASVITNINTLLNKERVSAKSLPILLSAFDKAIQSHQSRQQQRTVNTKGFLNQQPTIPKAYLTKDERTVIHDILGWEISFNSTNNTYYYPSRIAGLAGMIRTCIRDNSMLQQQSSSTQGDSISLPAFDPVLMDIGKLWDQRRITLNESNITTITPKSVFETVISEEIQNIYQQLYGQNVNNIQTTYQNKIEVNKFLSLSSTDPSIGTTGSIEVDMFIPQRTNKKSNTKHPSSSISSSGTNPQGAVIEIDGPYHYVPFAPEEIVAANLTNSKGTSTSLPLYTFDEIYDTYTLPIAIALHKRHVHPLTSSSSSTIDISGYEIFWNQRRKYADQVRNVQLRSTFVTNKQLPFLSVPFWHPLLLTESTKMFNKGSRASNHNESHGSSSSWTKELQNMLLHLLTTQPKN